MKKMICDYSWRTHAIYDDDNRKRDDLMFLREFGFDLVVESINLERSTVLHWKIDWIDDMAIIDLSGWLMTDITPYSQYPIIRTFVDSIDLHDLTIKNATDVSLKYFLRRRELDYLLEIIICNVTLLFTLCIYLCLFQC